MDIQRLIAFVVFSFSALLLWDAWQKHNAPKAPAPAIPVAGAPAAPAGAPTPTPSVPVSPQGAPAASPAAPATAPGAAESAPAAPSPATGATAAELSTPPPPPPAPPPAADQVDQGEGWTEPAPGGALPGYRVQIFASSEEPRAKEVASEARSRLGEPVYVVYEAPLYKVRVGDCVTRAEADALKERAVGQGFDGAWVAETMVQAR